MSSKISIQQSFFSLIIKSAAITFVIILCVASYLNISSRLYLHEESDPLITSIFDFSVNKTTDGEIIKLSEYKGKKAYLVVNVACKCGLTDRNYNELQELYSKYSLHGLEILAFPCNNFNNQEPGTYEEIIDYARGVKKAEFPILGKIECDNGARTHPLYKFLQRSLTAREWFGVGLKWNFAKFLCDENGTPIKRYWPVKSPLALEKDILELLSKKE